MLAAPHDAPVPDALRPRRVVASSRLASPSALVASAWLAASVLSSSLSAGCGPKKVQGVPLADIQRAEAIAAENPPPEPKDEDPHLVRWPQYDGPMTKVPLKGPRAWAVAPLPAGGSSCSYANGVSVSVENYLREAGTQNVFKLDHWEGCEFAAPGALTMPLDEKPPKPGDLILAELDNGSQFGVVRRVSKDKITYTEKVSVVKGKTQNAECKLGEAMVIGASPRLGAPAAVLDGGRWYLAQYLVGDERAAWVVRQGNPHAIKVEAAAVRIVDHTRPFKQGQKVLAARTGEVAESDFELEPGKVTRVLDDVILEVQFDATNGKEYVPIENVSPPIAR